MIKYNSEKAMGPSERRGNALLRIVEHPDVELLINFVILLNLAALAAADPVAGERDGRNGTLWWIGGSPLHEHARLSIYFMQTSLGPYSCYLCVLSSASSKMKHSSFLSQTWHATSSSLLRY
jgi:hypothetical protein